MDGDDIEGAKAAAEYFLSLYPYVYVTGDLSAWNEMSHPECMFCAGVVENVEELHSSGGYADGPAIDIVEINAEVPDAEYEYYAVWVDAVEHPSSRFDGSGEVQGTTGGSVIAADMAIEWTGETWRVRGAVVTPEGEGEVR